MIADADPPHHYSGQYDIIVDTSVGSDGDAYYIRAAICAAALAGVPSGYDIFALAALRYVADGSTPTTTDPTSSDWSDSDNSEATCSDFPDSSLVPLATDNAPSSVLDSVILVSLTRPKLSAAPPYLTLCYWRQSSAVGTITDSDSDTLVRFFWNSVTWSNVSRPLSIVSEQVAYCALPKYIYQPLLFKIQAGDTIADSNITHHIFTANGGADIVINNLDTALDHPYHLHGNPFYIVARGSGALSSTTYPDTAVATSNPPKRDTVRSTLLLPPPCRPRRSNN